jgi:hypothetical protein
LPHQHDLERRIRLHLAKQFAGQIRQDNGIGEFLAIRQTGKLWKAAAYQ